MAYPQPGDTHEGSTISSQQHEALCGWNWPKQRGDEKLRAEALAAIKSGRIGDSLLLRLIRSNIVSAPSLYRGMQVPEDCPMLTYKPGDIFDMLPASFSRTTTHASYFFRSRFNPFPVHTFLWLRAKPNIPIQGFDLSAYLRSMDHQPHKAEEVITAGRFRVMDARSLHEGRLLVIEQDGVFGEPPYPERDASFSYTGPASV
jgi:hypothetical protein